MTSHPLKIKTLFASLHSLPTLLPLGLGIPATHFIFLFMGGGFLNAHAPFCLWATGPAVPFAWNALFPLYQVNTYATS